MKIGILGTGLMGQPMAKRLLDSKISVIAYNRTQSKLEPLQEAGAEIANSPPEAIEASDCIILMLSDANAITQVLLDYPSSLTNRTVIQMGTIAPSESREICESVVAAGGEYLEAPVLGSIPQVKTGELLVMVGSSEEQFSKWSNLLKNFSPEPLHIGSVGTAAALKLALNQLIASLTSGFALSLGLIEREGVDVDKFMKVLRESALYARTFDKKLSRMRDRNFTNPNFPTKHLLKDTDLFLAQAKENGLDATGLEGIRKIIQKAMENSLAEDDYSSISSVINP